MTLAAQLARLLCEEIEPVPGVVHDPTQPLVLGNQSGNDYVVITWDAIQHRVNIQSVYLPPGGSLQQSNLTFSYDGKLLINGTSIANTAELQALLAAAQAAAAQSVASAAASAASAAEAEGSAQGAADSADLAGDRADLSLAFAQAPSGTELPGGGNSSAVSAAIAQEIANESRDLDIGAVVSANETFQSGFMFTERQVIPGVPGSTVEITIPPNMFQSPEKKARWASYRLRAATGGVKFIGAAGGTNLVTPQRVNSGRTMFRFLGSSVASRHTLAVPISWATTIVDGEILLVFNAQHNGPAQAPTLNFSATGGLTWTPLVAYPAAPLAVAMPMYYVTRVRVTNLAPGALTASFDEGGGWTHFQACDWLILDGVEGSAPIVTLDNRTSTGVVQRKVILPAVPAQSYLYGLAQIGQPAANGQWSAFSTNLTKRQSGNSSGADDVATPDDNTYKNQVWAVGDGVATAAGDTTLTCNFSGAPGRGNMIGFAYKPKTVIGGGTVVMNYEGDRDTLTVKNGVAELWFQNDGVTCDVRTPKP